MSPSASVTHTIARIGCPLDTNWHLALNFHRKGCNVPHMGCFKRKMMYYDSVKEGRSCLASCFSRVPTTQLNSRTGIDPISYLKSYTSTCLEICSEGKYLICIPSRAISYISSFSPLAWRQHISSNPPVEPPKSNLNCYWNLRYCSKVQNE